MPQEDRLTGLVGYSGMKVPVALATTAAITLSGEQTIDGVAAVTGDRVLVKDQADQTENGIYVVDTGDWNRAADCDGSYDLVQGSVVYVNAGSTGTGFWYCTSANPVDIESDNITWARASSVLAAVSVFVQTLLDDADADAFMQTIVAAMTAETSINLGADYLIVGDASASDGRKSIAADVIPIRSVGGRLTLATGTPVMTTDQTAKTTVYFTPYNGDVIPIYDGTRMVPTVFTELSQATTDATKSPAAVAANKNYDVFVWNDAGTLRATRGPAWSSDTARGTGAGTSELVMTKGVYLNANDITNGPAANRGTYVGTIRSNGSSQIDWKLGSAAAGGGAAVLGVWSTYNRIEFAPSARDTTDSWTYTSATLRQFNNSTGNQVSAVIGLSEDAVTADVFGQTSNNSGSEQGQDVGVGINSTTVNSAQMLNVGISTAVGNSSGKPFARYVGFPGIGYYTLAALEWVPAPNGTTTWIGDGGGTSVQTGIFARIKA